MKHLSFSSAWVKETKNGYPFQNYSENETVSLGQVDILPPVSLEQQFILTENALFFPLPYPVQRTPHQLLTVWNRRALPQTGLPDWGPWLLQSDPTPYLGRTRLCQLPLHKCSSWPCHHLTAGQIIGLWSLWVDGLVGEDEVAFS